MFKILIVDPNDPFRRSLKKVLVNRFPLVDIQEAADGDEGLRIVEAVHPHIIFLEIHLPAETGLNLASRIKADHPDIVIVILTSYDLPEYKLAVSKSGVEHMVPKDDWTGEDMIALVQSILSDLKMDEHGNMKILGFFFIDTQHVVCNIKNVHLLGLNKRHREFYRHRFFC